MQAVEAEAARLYLRARASDAEEDWTAAYSWVARDPSHGFAFAKAEASWELTERLNELPFGGENAETSARTSPQWDSARAASADFLPAMLNRRMVLGIAAATIGFAVTGTVAIRLLDTVDHYRTALGESRAVRLADGSTVHLNTSSSIEVALRDDVRLIRLLKGEARFDVAHDRLRPFIVDANGTRVRAVGTTFNVRLRAQLTELTVIEGIVAVQNDGSPSRKVGAGKSAAVRSGSIAITPLDPGKLKQRTAWQGGMIQFDGDTLEQAVEEFNRYRATPLVIGDPAIASIRIGGTFRSGRSDDFVFALEHGFGVRAVAGNDNSVILVAAE